MPQSINKSSVYNSWFHYLAWLPIPIFFIIILFLAWFRPGIVWNPLLLFTSLNIIFLTLIMIFVSILAIRSYLAKNSLIILLLGSGSLALGLGGLIAGIAILGNSPNSTVSIYNTSACISGIFILASAVLSISMKTKILKSLWPLLTSYIAVIALICFVALLVGIHVWPVYFVEGTGPTNIDLAVLYTTIILFAVSALLLLIHSIRDNLNFRIWYGLGLGLIAIGLIGVSLQKDIGDALNWIGRISQYLGTVYILIAIITSIRETGVWLLPWQQSLYEMEEKYYSIFTSMSEGVAIHSILFDEEDNAVDYIVQDVNPSYEEILGLKKEDVIGKKSTEIYGTINPPYLDVYSLVAKTSNPKTFETYFESMNKYFRISVTSPEKGKFVTVFDDITERKQSEEKILKAQKEWEHTFDAVPDILAIVDRNYKILQVNQPMASRLGLELEDCVGLKCYELIHGSNEPPLNCPHTQMLEDGLEHTIEFYEDKLHGNFISSSSPIYNENKELTKCVHVLRDITKLKKIEENLKSTMNDLKHSNKELEQFAYITSHDLREPLRMITNFLQLLERRYTDQLDQDAKEYIGFAVDGAKRLDNMTNDLLSYSRITTKKEEINNVNYEDVLKEALINLKVPIEKNNAVITHDPLPTIKGNEQFKFQLFQNLIGNAIKYRSQETPKIHISATKENNQYLFSIKDNGIGMSPDHLKRIFTIFQRLHTQAEYEGTGIGLAIAQKIVHQQGGQIWVESELGKGSTFYFTIPDK